MINSKIAENRIALYIYIYIYIDNIINEIISDIRTKGTYMFFACKFLLSFFGISKVYLKARDAP